VIKDLGEFGNDLRLVLFRARMLLVDRAAWLRGFMKPELRSPKNMLRPTSPEGSRTCGGDAAWFPGFQQSTNTKYADPIDRMKLRITVTGPKVHDVGYRYLLLGGAMSLRLPGFYATNLAEPEKQIVEILVEGKESQIKEFMEFVQNNKPANARVSNITASDCEDDIPRRSEYTQDLTALQMLKAIPTMLKIEENTQLIPEIAENTKPIPKIIEELQPGYAMQFREVQADIRTIKDRLGMP